MEEAHVCPLGADEDDGVTYARTHAGGFFGEGVFFVFLVNVVVTCMLRGGGAGGGGGRGRGR